MCNADGSAAALTAAMKKKGKPRGRPFQRKQALCESAFHSENDSPHGLSAPLEVCVAVLADDSLPAGRPVEAVASGPSAVRMCVQFIAM